MKRYLFLILIIFSATNLFSQNELVRTYLARVADGDIDEVKMQTVDLLATYPNDPGVMYLQGVVIDDINKSIDIFKKIIKNSPTSEWADDAYWRIVLYHVVKGDTTVAKSELANFRKRYPQSEFLAAANDAVRTLVSVSRLARTSKVVDKPTEHSVLPTATRTETAKGKNNISKTKAETAKGMTTTNKSKPVVKNPKPDEDISEEVDEKPIPTPAVKQKNNASKTKTTVTVAEPKTTVANDDKNETKGSTEEATSDKPIYHLQVGIYSTKDAAEHEMEKFLQQRLRTKVIEKNVDGQVMYAVVIGEYTSLDNAEAAKEKVQQQCKCSPLILKK